MIEMTVKTKSVFSCNECVAQAPKWSGQCAACGSWNTLVETLADSTVSSRLARRAPSVGVQSLGAVKLQSVARIRTGLSEMDRVLGGGMVVGSVV